MKQKELYHVESNVEAKMKKVAKTACKVLSGKRGWNKDCSHEQARRLRAVEAKLRMSVELASLGKDV